jgi:hypothetical protein
MPPGDLVGSGEDGFWDARSESFSPLPLRVLDDDPRVM